MSQAALARSFTRVQLRAAPGVLLVLREPVIAVQSTGQPPIVSANPNEGMEPLVAVWADGSISAYCGHVDLGTGLATALAQLVAEELDTSVSAIDVRLGDTAAVPNQGATIASASIQIHAYPLRYAAAQAARWLREHAAQSLGVSPENVSLEGSRLIAQGDQSSSAHSLPIADLLAGQHYELMLDTSTALKPTSEHRVIGTAAPRRDIEAKAKGELVFVHDMRVPGMLHGRVVRPPYAGLDHGEFVGNTLDSIDRDSIVHIPGVRAVFTQGDFVGVIAEREEHAAQAMRELDVRWKTWPGMPNLDDLAQALRANPAKKRTLVDEGNVEAAIDGAQESLQRTYVWPYQLHASLGPSCALAQWFTELTDGIRLRVWSGTQNPHVLRADLARLMGVADVEVDVVRMEAAGCYGRNGADDVSADAALLARAAGAPVRVQLTREQENQWEPKGAAQLMTVRGGVNADGSPVAYDFETSYPSNAAPTLALLLTGAVKPVAQAFEMGDRTARPPYAFANLRVAVNDMPPILRASWLRGVSALPNSFAHESYMDELASTAQIDPVEYRLRYLDDERAKTIIRQTAARASWQSKYAQGAHSAKTPYADTEIVSGQGFAYARYVHSKWPGFGAAWSAWVADVDVNRRTGEVHVKRVVVGHDAGLVVNPAGVEHQIHGNVIQTTSRALKEKVQTNEHAIQSREWGSYPILSFREVPVIEVVQIPRPDQPPLGAGESSSVPGTAAIANAIFDATGVRFRQPPFTPDVVREGLRSAGHLVAPLHEAGSGQHGNPVLTDKLSYSTSSVFLGRKLTVARKVALTLKVGFAAIGVVAGFLGIRIAMETLSPASLAARSHPLNNPYSQETIKRGRELSALGNCIGCHTSASGIAGAGGRAIETPFGTIYSTNITRHLATGIGTWSLPAFMRAMREGIANDGRHLYPAFPFTSFAKMTDEDLTALYAFFMSEPAHAAAKPENRLSFPYNQRPLLGVWKAMFHDASPIIADTAQSALWNRGAYLVQSVGHCGACHTPRNTLGAERAGEATFAGAKVDGWYAPPLTALSSSPVTWTEAALYDYLRHGHSKEHGAASGSMAEVVRSLRGANNDDIRAMAVYLASLTAHGAASITPEHQVRAAIATGERSFVPQSTLGEQLFSGACRQCHHAGDGPPVFGLNIPLALNSHLHSEQPNNVVRILLEGIRDPASKDSGFMPPFAEAFDDEQVAAIMRYLRERYAPSQAPWPNLDAAIKAVRAELTSKQAAEKAR